MNSRALITIMTLVLGLVALAGCSDNSNELQRVVCEVESVNGGTPLISAALNYGGDRAPGGGDDYVPIDSVPVLFRARAYNSTMNIPEDGTYSSYIITSYSLEWNTNDPNAPANLTDYNITNAATSVKVPVDDEGMVSVLVAPLQMKNEGWFQAILGGSAPAFTATATLTFTGHVSATDHESTVSGGVAVNFIGAIVD